MSSILIKFRDLNKGSALYLLLVTVLTAFFWNLNKREENMPQAKIPYWKYGKIRLVYKVLRICSGKKCFSIQIMPIHLDTLQEILSI